MAPVHHEKRFEDAIEDSLLASGWVAGDSDDYDKDLGLDTAQLFAFIGATQGDAWERLRAYHGDDADGAQRAFVELLAREIDERGTLDVLRHGVKDRGVRINLAYFRPAHTLAEGALDDYRRNRLTVTRQLRYSRRDPRNAPDLTLFVNGLPVATAELKNPLTGQTVDDAKHQYRRRDPMEPLFARRTLVHFAVDPDLVFVTTRLAGDDTRFLPFNTGSEGPGVSGGAGNPSAAPGAYRTSYLWELIWQPDVWLDLLRRYLHVDRSGERDRRARRRRPHELPLIFPRFHQWHAVGRLVEHAERHGSGQNYLVMHSAGSGKSNTIAWLAHRLSALHTPDDVNLLDPAARAAGLEPNQPVFDKVIVITDRSVLDRQLQDTIYQFEHTAGVVVRADGREGSKSSQVAEALGNSTAKIVIATLQTFPHVLDQVGGLRGKRFAVIVDEAHSSQSGESAADLKRVLLKLGSDELDEDGDPLTAAALARGRHRELSYFAFTATPKQKTLELFGTPDPVTGNPRPFHVYSMRQAIEEGFILDVLRAYTTYKTYWKLANANPDDREVDPKKAGAQLARFAELHPTSMEQRAEIIVEHFNRNVAGRLGGRAKAMVVTRSREHAVRLYWALRTYVKTLGYEHIGVLVAFSGSLEIDGTEVTEAGLNGIGEAALPKAFGYTRADDERAATSTTPEYRILVVADKYQTGFDQPLLTTMYVDKRLHGVAAVQTLSRLNRTHPLKNQDDVFVLDFTNDAESVREEFKPFYETAITAPTDPNLIYTAHRALMDHQLIDGAEVRAFADEYRRALRAASSKVRWQNAHAALYRLTDPARDRFAALQADDRQAAEEFRADLRDYLRKYGFLAQVVDYADDELEEWYVFGRHLLNRLPRRDDPGVDIGQVDLTHLRISKTGEHDLGLEPEGGEHMLPGFTGAGGAVRDAPEQVQLSQLIDEFNQRYGLGCTEDDMVNPVASTLDDEEVRQAGRANDERHFANIFDQRFEEHMIDYAESKMTLLKKFLDDAEFKADWTALARRRAFEMIRREAA